MASDITQQPKAPSAGIIKLAKDVFAGTCGGISVTAVGHPFDTIKVRLQTQSMGSPFMKTVQWEGLPGLYKGVASPLAGQMFFRASLFGAFGESKRWLATNADGSSRALRTADYYKAGAITGFIAAFTEGPIDFYKSQIQVQIIRSKADPAYSPPYTTVSACVRATIRENGFKGPFQGLSATILRNTPANAVYLGSFEVLKGAAAKQLECKSNAELPAWAVLSSAALGGIAYWLAIFPVDVIKSSMQTDNIIRSQRRFPDMVTAAKLLWSEGGVKRFYKGFTPCLIRAAPANGAMLYTVDKVTHMLNEE
ncbi:mitochondrial carrier domain-containing protein [Scenedesmus sp. NREL 46B-D3]|nr:mitochondrial carrier domain-containing protein [Scenedesmus sp. NREL 46B-D3]